MASIRDDFDLYEERALKVSVVKEYEKDARQKRTRVVQADESNEGHTQFQGRDDFKVNAFLPILDQLHSALRETYADAREIDDKFTTIIQQTFKESEMRAQAQNSTRIISRGFRRPLF